MTRSRHMLLIIAVYCIACLGAAFYFQRYLNVAPCPLCVLQRYIFFMIIICCLVGWMLPAHRIPAFFGLTFSLGGIGAASWQIWTSSKLNLTCGTDAFGDVLNHLVTAKWFPLLFTAKGSCVQEKVILGLTTPQWAAAAYVLVSLAFLQIILNTKARRGRS